MQDKYSTHVGGQFEDRILHSEWKIIAKIELSVICTQIVDFHRPGD